jgi:hypothetical protein
VATVIDLNWRSGLRTLWSVSAVLGMFWLIFTKWIVGSIVLGVVLGLLAAAWRRLHPKCTHPFVRCVHGDEINQANGARVMCLGCQRYLPDRPMLRICTFTGYSHGYKGA